MGLGSPCTSQGISNSEPNSPRVSKAILDEKCGFSGEEKEKVRKVMECWSS